LETGAVVLVDPAAGAGVGRGGELREAGGQGGDRQGVPARELEGRAGAAPGVDPGDGVLERRGRGGHGEGGADGPAVQRGGRWGGAGGRGGQRGGRRGLAGRGRGVLGDGAFDEVLLDQAAGERLEPELEVVALGGVEERRLGEPAGGGEGAVLVAGLVLREAG